MKKIFALFMVILLSACFQDVKQQQPIPQEPITIPEPDPTPQEQANQIELNLLAENNISSVLKFYEQMHGLETHSFKAICSKCITCTYNPLVVDELIKLSTDTKPENIPCLTVSYCDYTAGAPEFSQAYYTDNSDECILIRRSIKPSKISYFNYKKYIKNHNGLKNEDDFIKLYTMYRAIKAFDRDNQLVIFHEFSSKYSTRKCFTNTELTNAEWEQCEEEKNQFLTNMAAGTAKKCSVKYPKQWKAWIKNYTGYQAQIEFGAVNLCIPDKIDIDRYVWF